MTPLPVGRPAAASGARLPVLRPDGHHDGVASLSGPENAPRPKLAATATVDLGTVDHEAVVAAADARVPEVARLVLAAFRRWADGWTYESLAAVLSVTPGAAADILDPDRPESPLLKAEDSADTMARVLGQIMAAAVEGGLTRSNFTLVNPSAVRAAATRSADLIRQINDDVRALIRQIIANGVGGGATPQGMARQIIDVIGLTTRQAQAVANFRLALTRGDVKRALGHALRDHRLAITPGMTQAQIDRAVTRYAERYLRYRATMIARTETMWSANQGLLAEWEMALAEGLLPPHTVKVWYTSPDERACDVCVQLDTERVPLQATFSVGIEGPPQHPHCRCTVSLDTTIDTVADRTGALVLA